MPETRDFFDRMASRWDDSHQPDARILDYILGRAPVPPGGRVLDAGCGTGVLLPRLRALLGPEGQLYAADISPAMLERARERHRGIDVTYLEADLARLPLASGHLDLVMCFFMFPHVADKQAALREVCRVLKPSGTLVIAHASGREAINQRHAEIGGVISEHTLPSGTCLARMLRLAGLTPTCVEDEPDRYLVMGVRDDWQ